MSYFPSLAVGGTRSLHVATHIAGAVDELVLSLLAGTATNAQVPESAITQHQAALSIAATQLTGTISSARLSGVYSGITGLDEQAQALDMGANAITDVGTIAASGVVTISASGKAIDLTGATSRRIHWGQSGAAIPTFNSLSAGVKLALWDDVDATKAGYAIGIAASTMWFGVSTTAARFEWYHGIGLALKLTDTALEGSSITLGTAATPWSNAFIATLATDTIIERTTNSGVTIDGLLIKDSTIQLTSSTAVLQFTSSAASDKGIQYAETGGTARFGLLFPGSDIVALSNRAANGVVQIRANTGTAGGGGEVTVAEFQDDQISFQGLPVSMGALTATGITTLNTVAYTWPASDGSAGDRLQTDGSGGLSWVTP